MKKDYILDDKNKKYRLKHIRLIISIISLIFLTTFCVVIFADSAVVKIIDKSDGSQSLYFELEHNVTTAQYKYYGYGYTVSVKDTKTGQFLTLKNGEKQYFMKNKDFNPVQNGSKETVDIPIKNIYDILGVEQKYYYHDGLEIWLNARMGIRVNNILTRLYDTIDGQCLISKGMSYLEQGTYKPIEGHSNVAVPLNSDEYGIKNALKAYYGIDWSKTTQDNFEQHFGINKRLKAAYQFDGYMVKYIDKKTEKVIDETDIIACTAVGDIPVSPEIKTGYNYIGKYKIDKMNSNGTLTFGTEQQGDIVTISIKKSKAPIVYVVNFYYEKPDSGTPVEVKVEYRLNTKDGQKVANDKTVTGYVNTLFNLSSEKLDDYLCKKYIVIGQSEHEADGTSISFKMNSQKWCTPINGTLKVIFIYEERPVVVIPKCEPRFDGLIGSKTINMKRSEFDKIEKISIQNASFGIENITVGEDKNKNKVEGEHKFDTFDFYVYINGKGTPPFEAKWDNAGYSTTHSFDVPKTMFTKVNDNTYIASIDVDYVSFCSCKGAGFSLWPYYEIVVNIIENKPPEAKFDVYTEVKQEDGSMRKIYEVYYDVPFKIENLASDPNGVEDLGYMSFTFNAPDGTLGALFEFDVENGIYSLKNHEIYYEYFELKETNANGDVIMKWHKPEE